MKKEYNLRKSKIYSDYKDYSPDRLLEILKNKENFLPEVIEIVNDIIVERNDIPAFVKKDLVAEWTREKAEEEKLEKLEIEQQLKLDVKKKQAGINEFLSKSEHYSDVELAGIITRYLYYEQEAVEAAIIISEKRKTISHEEKEKLLLQIEAGFRKKQKQEKTVIKERKKISRVEIIFGILLLSLGIILQLTDFRIFIHGTPVVFYGMILGGIGLVIDGLF
jgi:hypothetical protein